MTESYEGPLPSEEELAEANQLASRLGIEPPTYVGNFPFKNAAGIADQEEAEAVMRYARRFDSDITDMRSLPETDEPII